MIITKNVLITWIIPIALFTSGLIGNTVGFIMFSKKNLEKCLTRNIYRTLALTNTAYVLYRIMITVSDFQIRLELISNISCQMMNYFDYTLGSLSAWILVYISVEKFISIQFNRIKLVRSNLFQYLVIISVFLFNFIYYTPLIIFHELKLLNDSVLNETIKICNASTLREENIMDIMDLLNSTILPFVLMIIATCLLIFTIIRVKIRFLKINSIERNRNLRKEIKFGITSILMNLNFFVLNIPVCIVYIIDGHHMEDESLVLKITNILFHASFCTNFYIFAIFNSTYRRELLLLFKLKKTRPRTSASISGNSS